MKIAFVVLVITIAIFAFVKSSPIESDGEGELIRADRHKRLTCDLLSVQTSKFSVNHSACAAHCLALMKGYKGGNCQNGVCHCRK
ncbi:hypothetical protein RN001_000637 [Aquatica leii]|uniref:Invertebrate defensins family profile domain-containing protein n=1 Tax=Aquatica leii TaxID=1421715 RepID=A0AAN7PKD8_9COLE|nr:hypothetical protein RN001_000637 [Aquatica leii]